MIIPHPGQRWVFKLRQRTTGTGNSGLQFDPMQGVPSKQTPELSDWWEDFKAELHGMEFV